jgi:hypothetical protein
MKSLFISLVCLFMFLSTSFSQDNFKVIKVNGSILLRAKNVSLQTGTIFSEKEDLLFRTEDATAAVINSQKGRLILTANNHDLSKIQANYLPAMYNVSTRGGSLSNIVDLQNHFSGKYVVLDKQKIVMDTEAFPMNSDQYFYLKYTYKGEEIPKKLNFSGDTLIIDKKNLYTVDEQPIPRPDNTIIKLFYLNGNKSLQISEFNLIFPDTKQLKEEVKIILDTMKNLPSKDQVGEVTAYIYDQYGKIQRDNLVAWMKVNLGFQIK